MSTELGDLDLGLVTPEIYNIVTMSTELGDLDLGLVTPEIYNTVTN